MKLVIDALWRAVGYMLMPRVIWLSLLPLLVSVVGTALLGWLYWEDAVTAVRTALDQWALSQTVLGWLDGMGLPGLRVVVAPLIVVSLAGPVAIVLSLLIVGVWMSPAMATLVRERRFATLPSRADEPVLVSVLRSLALSLAALLALLVSLPLWLIPPLAALIPPLIWGWLTAQVMSADVLVEHASRAERRRIMREHRWPLLAIGIVIGYLSAIPSLVWAFGAVTALVFAPVLIPLAVWLYILVFAFASLWYAHYCLAALQALRQPPGGVAIDVPVAVPAALPPAAPTDSPAS